MNIMYGSQKHTDVATVAKSSGIDIAALYIDMLCEKFKNRGISTHVASEKNKDDAKTQKLKYEMSQSGVFASDEKYKTEICDGKKYMNSTDFSNYYIDLRNYKLPNFYQRPQTEYEQAELSAQQQEQEAMVKPTKKEMWLAITSMATSKIKQVPSHLNTQELEKFSQEWLGIEEVYGKVEHKKIKIPCSIIAYFLIVATSLVLIVSSTVMVSHTQSQIKSLENSLVSLDSILEELNTDLEIKNDMINIKDIATGQYGMVAAQYINSIYIDIQQNDGIELE